MGIVSIQCPARLGGPLLSSSSAEESLLEDTTWDDFAATLADALSAIQSSALAWFAFALANSLTIL